MKRFLQSAFVLALATMSVQNAVAADLCNNCRIYINDFAIKKGETKYIYIQIDNPDYEFTAGQFDMWFKGGIVPVEKNGRVTVSRQYRVPEDGFAGSGAWQKEGDNAKDHFRYLFYNAYGDYVEGTSGDVFRMQVTTDDTFGKTEEQPAIVFGGELKISDISDISKGHYLKESTTNVYEAIDLADFATATPGKTYFVANDVKVVGQSKEINGEVYNFVTDGIGNWMNVKTTKNELAQDETYAGGQLGGVYADGVNPSVALSKTFGTTAASTAISNDGVEKIDMTSAIEMVSNQVIAVTAYYFNDDNQESMRAYSGANGERGQSLTVDKSWSPSPITMENGKPYTITKAAVQLKAAWDAPAGAKVAPAEQYAFQNYVIYPLDAAQIATGIDGVTANKEVSSVRYYNVSGVEATAPFDGINLVVTTYTDGTTSTAKVIK